MFRYDLSYLFSTSLEVQKKKKKKKLKTCGASTLYHSTIWCKIPFLVKIPHTHTLNIQRIVMLILIYTFLGICRLKLILVLLFPRFQDFFSIVLPRKRLVNSFPSNVLRYVMMGLLVSQEFAWGRNDFALVISFYLFLGILLAYQNILIIWFSHKIDAWKDFKLLFFQRCVMSAVGIL